MAAQRCSPRRSGEPASSSSQKEDGTDCSSDDRSDDPKEDLLVVQGIPTTATLLPFATELPGTVSFDVYQATLELATKYAQTGIERDIKGHIVALGNADDVLKLGTLPLFNAFRDPSMHNVDVRDPEYREVLRRYMNHDGIIVIDGQTGKVHANEFMCTTSSKKVHAGGAKTKAAYGLAEHAVCVVVQISQDTNGEVTVIRGRGGSENAVSVVYKPGQRIVQKAPDREEDREEVEFKTVWTAVKVVEPFIKHDMVALLQAGGTMDMLDRQGPWGRFHDLFGEFETHKIFLNQCTAVAFEEFFHKLQADLVHMNNTILHVTSQSIGKDASLQLVQGAVTRVQTNWFSSLDAVLKTRR